MGRYRYVNPYVQSYSANRWASICGVPGNHGSFGTIAEKPVEAIVSSEPVSMPEPEPEKDIMEETPDMTLEDGYLYLGNSGASQLGSAAYQGKLAAFIKKVIGETKIKNILDYTGEDSNVDWYRDNKYRLSSKSKEDLRSIALENFRLFYNLQ